MSGSCNTDEAPDFRAYLVSRETLWFRVSLALIFSFFIFSFITSENFLILLIKRVTTLVFAFLIPGYVVTRAIYPKKIDPIERFAFSVAFSLTFVMVVTYALDRAAITRLLLAVATFLLALVFTFTAVLRGYRTTKGGSAKGSFKSTILPLLIIGIFAFILNSYDPITSPVLGASDPYAWAYTTDYIIQSEHIPLERQVQFYTGYPPGFTLITTFLVIFMDVTAYDVMRYIPIFSFLNIVPTYLLAYHIFRSRHVSLLAAVLIMSTNFLFRYGGVAVPQMMVHFFLVLFLLALLRTLEEPSTKNSIVAALLLSSTLLLYHYEVVILAVFLPLVFLVVCLQSRIKLKVLKSAFIVGTVSALVSGSLWYFLVVSNLARSFLTKGYLNPSRGYFSEKNIYPETYMYVFYDGWLLVLFSIIGLALILLKSEQRSKIRYQFLVIYLFTILFLIEAAPKHVAVSAHSTFYIFTYLTFPLAMLASYALVNIVSRIKDVRGRNGMYASILVAIFLVNINSFNYYYPPSDDSTYYLDRELDGGNYKALFFFRYYWNKPITEHEYDAFWWIGENVPQNSRVIYWWYPYKAYGQRICECGAMPISALNVSDSTSTEIMKKTYQRHRLMGTDIYVITGLLHSPLAIRIAQDHPDFSNRTLKSMAADPNFKVVYQNPQVKIYKIEFDNYAVFLDKPGGFKEDFEDLFYWGTNLNENDTLSARNGVGTYRANTSYQPVDVVFSRGINTGIYPYFETKIRVIGGKISIGVYDSTGKAHMFLNNFTTKGKMEAYKLNLNDWLSRNGYETEVYGIIMTNTLDGDKSFKSHIGKMSIHNHIFWDMFEDESKIKDMDDARVDAGDVSLSRIPIEILSNGGFENDTTGWRPQAKWSIDSGEAHSGGMSAVLRGTVDPAKDPSAYLDTEVYTDVLKPGRSYRLSAWIKGNVTDALRAAIRQSGSAKPWSAWVYFARNGEYGNWTYSEGMITTPDDVDGDFWIRIYGGGNPAVWIDNVSFDEAVYLPSGTLISTATNTKNPIVSVMPAWTSTESDGKNITIEISVDNGTTWTPAANRVQINYTASDSNRHMLYRAFLTTNDAYQSPLLHDITLTYEEQSSAQRPAEPITEEPVERASTTAELVLDLKLNKYEVKRGEEVEVTYAVKNVGPLAIEGYLTIDDVSRDNKSVKTQLFAAYPRTPYKIGPGETVNFKRTFTVSGSAPAGRYRMWRAMWEQDLKKWAGPYNKEGEGEAAYMEVISK